MSGKAGFTGYLRSYIVSSLFSKGWPGWVGGALLGIINVFFLAWALKPFTIFSGYLNWGRHFYELLGFSSFVGSPTSNPLLNKTSVGDIGLMLGALLAALLSREFKIRKPLSNVEYFDAVLGGFLMSSGTVLAIGCNWGGFFSAITVLSLHGFPMLIGLVIGGWLGLFYVKRRVEKALELGELPLSESVSEVTLRRSKTLRKLSITIASLVLIFALIALLFFYVLTKESLYLGILLMGVAVGIVIQRSRFCFASAFRDLIKGPEFDRSISLQKGIIIGLLIGISGSFILKYLGYIDPLIYVKPVGISNLVGGILFGLGMVIAGGCASGTLWRAAEGHIKLWLTLLTMVISYPVLRALIRDYASFIFGPKLFIPYLLGWGLGLIVTYVLILLYFIFLMYLMYKFKILSR